MDMDIQVKRRPKSLNEGDGAAQGSRDALLPGAATLPSEQRAQKQPLHEADELGTPRQKEAQALGKGEDPLSHRDGREHAVSMALFPGDPAQAIRAGIAMHREVQAYNARNPGRPALAIGVGIHTGRVMMGTIGEEQRFEATVISDTVNLTARMETLTKQLGVTMLVSQSVADCLTVQEQETTRWLGTFIVKGKTTPVELVEVFTADEDHLGAHKYATRERVRSAVDAYRNNDLATAAAEFAALTQLQSQDGPARWWLEFLNSERVRISPAMARDAIRLDEK